MADTLSLSTSPSQPSDAVPPQIVADGDTSHADAVLHVDYRQADTGGCAGDPTLDPGTPASPDGTGLGVNQFGPVVGDPQPLSIGTYLLCGWITDPNDETVVFAAASAAFTVAASDSVALAPVPGAVEGRPFDIDATGLAYDPDAIIDATYKPAGGTCAASPDLDTGIVANDSGNPPDPGPYSDPVVSQQVLDAGRYLVCAWLIDQQDPTHPLGVASETISVRPVQASIQLRAPGRIDGGQTFALTLSANVDWGVPLTAIADLKPKTKGSGCAGNPDGEPAAAAQELNEQLTGTQQPAGVVSSTNSHVSVPGFGAYLVCAWLLNGWTTAANPPTVAGPISDTVTAVRPETLRGLTSQHLPIKMTLAPVEDLILAISYKDRLQCAGPATFTNGTPWNGLWSNDLGKGVLGTLRVRSGSFGVNVTGKHSHTFKLQGHVRRKRITGTLSEHGKSSAFTSNPAQGLSCGTGTVRYTVRTR
ncbi:MAG TPA: hypothetical protein VFI54_26210 [Solirubrobacteraceae bacterium]|nr:hypothetical protein [Solirubrobacteraceae bacterium]